MKSIRANNVIKVNTLVNVQWYIKDLSCSPKGLIHRIYYRAEKRNKFQPWCI
jgi:hypothetical protein